MNNEKEEQFLIPVDQFGNWTETQLRKVTKSELDKLLDHYGNQVLSICSNGVKGARIMWACFKSRINNGCYSDMINAYRLLSGDHTDLVRREHELRHAWNHYEELWAIRYYGSPEAYYINQAKQARNNTAYRHEVDNNAQ